MTMIQPDFMRQQDFVTPAQLSKHPITIIGAGGIGSPLTLLLAKMGCSRITVFDPDRVEAHNLPNQLYRLADSGSEGIPGRLKVEALAEIVEAFTGTTITQVPEAYTNQPLTGIVIVAVDSMKARYEIWQRVRYNGAVVLFIDTRMGGLDAQIYAFNPLLTNSVEAYEDPGILYTDEDATEAACTARAILFNTFGIASVVGDIVKCFAKGERLPLQGIIKLIDFRTLVLI